VSTTDKDFKVKNGLIVEGSSATVNGNQVLTTASSIDSLQDVNTSGVQYKCFKLFKWCMDSCIRYWFTRYNRSTRYIWCTRNNWNHWFTGNNRNPRYYWKYWFSRNDRIQRYTRNYWITRINRLTRSYRITRNYRFSRYNWNTGNSGYNRR
jgi:hypothetical protein